MEKIPTYSQAVKRIRSITRCRRASQQKKPQRASPVRRDGFLNYQFTPVIEDMACNRHQMETEFFNSLSNFCGLYESTIPLQNEYPYPLNIVKGYEQAKSVLSDKAPDLELMIIADHAHAACLATVQSFAVGNTLYYIPVRPLADLLKRPARKKEKALLLSIFAYLYKVVDIPWFHETSTYLSDSYEMLESWMMDNEEEEGPEFKEEKIKDYSRLHKEAPEIENLLQNPQHLVQFEQRVQQFAPKNEAGRQLKKVATRTWELYRQYPSHTILQSVPDNLFFPDIEERIRIDQYISFFWDDNDTIYNWLEEQINNDLQECGATDEPASIQLFDQPQTTNTHSLYFEKELFELLDDLYSVLKKLP